MSTVDEQRHAVSAAVKRIVVAESRLTIDPAAVTDAEPLSGELLRINSLGFLGMLIRLEDELETSLPDEVFVGRSFHTVADLIDAVLTAEAVR